MTTWHIRDFVLDDLESAIRLDGLSTATDQRPVFGVSEFVESVQAHHPAVVAVSDGVVIGVAVSRVDNDRAWVLRLSIDPRWRYRGLGSDLLGELEHQLVGRGVRRITALLPDEETGSRAFLNSGFVSRGGITHFDKQHTVSPSSIDVLHRLAGVVPPAGLWQQIAGMSREKTLIERRIVLPLSEPEQAAEHGVRPPHAIVLFGPPGTGKTTFARAIASRLGWPFVEFFPSRLAGADGGLSAGLGDAFAQLSQLDNVVAFIDEVEEVAAQREPGSASSGVVNELLKSIVSFRERPGRLLVCATNSIRALDNAFLRHGRFDYVLPIGTPDEQARQSLWLRYLDTEAEDIDLEALVAATEGYTPADVEHAARVVAQATFESSIDSGRRCRPGTQDYLAAIGDTRPTLTDVLVREFDEDIANFARS